METIKKVIDSDNKITIIEYEVGTGIVNKIINMFDKNELMTINCAQIDETDLNDFDKFTKPFVIFEQFDRLMPSVLSKFMNKILSFNFKSILVVEELNNIDNSLLIRSKIIKK